MPALSSSLIGPALGQIADLPAGDRELVAAGRLSLLEHLARVPDPRRRRGVRHSLSSVLAAAIAAVMAGAQSFTAIGEWIADAPPPVLASLGIRRDPLTRRFEPPGEATICCVAPGGQTSPTRRRGLYLIRSISTGSWHWACSTAFPKTI